MKFNKEIKDIIRVEKARFLARRYIEHFQEPKRTCDSRRKDLGTGYYLVSGLDLIRPRDRFAHQLVPNVHP